MLWFWRERLDLSISLRLQNETKGLMQQVNGDLKKFLNAPMSAEDQVRQRMWWWLIPMICLVEKKKNLIGKFFQTISRTAQSFSKSSNYWCSKRERKSRTCTSCDLSSTGCIKWSPIIIATNATTSRYTNGTKCWYEWTKRTWWTTTTTRGTLTKMERRNIWRIFFSSRRILFKSVNCSKMYQDWFMNRVISLVG